MMRWLLGLGVLMTGFFLGAASAGMQAPTQAPPTPDLPYMVTTPAKLDAQQWSRFFKRYPGQWQRNVKRSTYAAGPASADPKQDWLHYDPQPDGRRVLYFVGEAQRKFGRIHALDGIPNLRTTNPKDDTFVARSPLDEFTMGNTLFRKSDGWVTNRHTFVFSPDGDAFVSVMMDRDEKSGKWRIGGIIHYCRPDNTECLNQ